MAITVEDIATVVPTETVKPAVATIETAGTLEVPATLTTPQNRRAANIGGGVEGPCTVQGKFHAHGRTTLHPHKNETGPPLTLTKYLLY